MSDYDALARLVQGIDPWRGHLVFVGGWAHRLYRFHPLAGAVSYQPILTKDTDLAFSNELPSVFRLPSPRAHAASFGSC